MNAPIPKAASLVAVTFTPDAAAERSLARTASIRVPRRLRRKYTTPMATITATTRHSIPNAARGYSPPVPMPRFRPKIDGDGTSIPDESTKSVLRNQNASSVYAIVSVTTATVRPRIRKAGKPITTPMTAANTAASSGAIGNGTFQLVVIGPTRNAATPAIASCARDT